MKVGSKGHRRQEETQKRQKKHKHKTNKSKTEETNKRQPHNTRRARNIYSSGGYARKAVL